MILYRAYSLLADLDYEVEVLDIGSQGLTLQRRPLTLDPALADRLGLSAPPGNRLFDWGPYALEKPRLRLAAAILHDASGSPDAAARWYVRYAEVRLAAALRNALVEWTDVAQDLADWSSDAAH